MVTDIVVIPAGHFSGGAHISTEKGDSRDLRTIINQLIATHNLIDATTTGGNVVQRDANGDVILPATPTNANAATPKTWVENLVSSTAYALEEKASCKAASTGNLTLSGTQTIDGIACVATDRVLCKNQTTPAENGIYVVAAGAWSRSADLAAGADAAGNFVTIEQGTANGEHTFICTNNKGGAVVGTDNLVFADWSAAVDHALLLNLTTGNPHTQYELKSAFFSATNGLRIVHHAKAASTGNLTLSGEQTIDGIACVTDDRVFAKDQTSKDENGIYICAAGAWARAADMATGATVEGMIVQVDQGTANGNKVFIETDYAGADVVDTDNLTFADISTRITHDSGIGLSTLAAGEYYHIGEHQRAVSQVRAASTGNLTLSGEQTIDAIACVTGERVLCKDQTSADENGIYVVDSGAWSRDLDWRTAATASGKTVYVSEGTAGGNKVFVCTNDAGSDVIDTDNLVIVDISTLLTHNSIAGLTTGDPHTQYEMKAALYNATDGMRAIHPVRAASTANLVLSAEQTIDGIACVTGERVLCKNQTSADENGIYVVAAGAWARAADMPTTATVAAATVYVNEGTANGDSIFVCTNNAGGDVVDTDNLTFEDVSALLDMTATPIGTANQVYKTNAGGTANEFGTIADANIGAGANIANAKLAAPQSFFCINVNLKDQAGAGAVTIHLQAPWAFTLTEVSASCSAISAGVDTVDVQEGGVSVLSAAITLVAGSNVVGTISDSDIADNADITVIATQAGAGALADVCVLITGKIAHTA